MRIIAKGINRIEDITRVFLRFEQELEPFNSVDPSIDFNESEIEGLSNEEIYSKAAINIKDLIVIPCFDRVGWSEAENREIDDIEGSEWIAPTIKTLTIQGPTHINKFFQKEPVIYTAMATDQYGGIIAVSEEELSWINQRITPDKVGEVEVNVVCGSVKSELTITVVDEEPVIQNNLTPEQEEIMKLKKQVADLTLVVAELIGGTK